MIPIPACVLVVSPVGGRLRTTIADGVRVAAGEVVATIRRGDTDTQVRTPRAGRMGGSLIGHGANVDIGEGVVWLDRT